MESKQRLLEPQLVQTGRADQFSRKVFCDGMRDGVPIALGYFAVSFSLGIAARKAGFTPFQGFLVSLLNNASAGEYAAFALIMANATYFEVAVITLIANARYLLMSCALAQRFAPETRYEDVDKYNELLHWFHYQCYLFTDSHQELTDTVKEYWEKTKEKDEQFIMTAYEALAHISKSAFLAYTAPKWLSLIFPADHPDHSLFVEECEKSQAFK